MRVSESRSSKCSVFFLKQMKRIHCRETLGQARPKEFKMFMFLMNKHVPVVAFIKGPDITIQEAEHNKSIRTLALKI
jgi:hypothetical protein